MKFFSGKNLTRTLLLAVTVIYCTLLFWIMNGRFTANFWIIFLCTLISPAAGFVTTFLKDTRETKIAFTTVIYRAFISHLIGQFLMHLILLFPNFPTVPVIVFEVVFAAALIAYVAYFSMGVEKIGNRIEEQQKELRYLANLQVTLQYAYDSAKDAEVKKALNKLLETVQYSPFESIPETVQTERELLAIANDLDAFTTEEQLKTVAQMQVMLNKRNNLISMLG